MGLYHSESDEAKAHAEVGCAPHKASLSHEMIAGAAAFAAARAYEDHQAKNGKIVEHAKAKEFLAAAGGAFVDRIVETKGLDFIDKEKAKRHAKENAEKALENSGQY